MKNNTVTAVLAAIVLVAVCQNAQAMKKSSQGSKKQAPASSARPVNPAQAKAQLARANEFISQLKEQQKDAISFGFFRKDQKPNAAFGNWMGVVVKSHAFITDNISKDQLGNPTDKLLVAELNKVIGQANTMAKSLVLISSPSTGAISNKLTAIQESAKTIAANLRAQVRKNPANIALWNLTIAIADSLAVLSGSAAKVAASAEFVAKSVKGK